mgnify:CR=1 FL=1
MAEPPVRRARTTRANAAARLILEELPAVLITEVLFWTQPALLGSLAALSKVFRDQHVPNTVRARMDVLGFAVPDPLPCSPPACALDYFEKCKRHTRTLAAGLSHSLCIHPSGPRGQTTALYSWGANSPDDGESAGAVDISTLGLGRPRGKCVRAPRRVDRAKECDSGDAQSFSATLLQVDSCASHCLVLTNRGEVMSWGEGSHGQLGFGEFSWELQFIGTSTPTAIADLMLLTRELIVQVSCGRSYSLLLSRSGRVYSFGDGQGGQLGHADFPNQLRKPKAVADLNKAGIVHVSAGTHSLAVSEAGTLYSWGWFCSGAPCRGPEVAAYNGPRCVPPAHIPGAVEVPGRVVRACSRDDHGLIVTTTGALFAYGRGEHGQLGQGNPRLPSFRQALRVSALDHVIVRDAAAGSRFSVALAENGQVYTFGWGDRSQNIAEHSRTHPSRPIRLSLPTALLICARAASYVLCPAHRCCLLDTADASLKSPMAGYHGTLGNGDDFPDTHEDDSICALPQLVRGLPSVAEIALGAKHVLARLCDGEVRAWGCNDAGQLGLGRSCETRQDVPATVCFPEPDADGEGGEDAYGTEEPDADGKGGEDADGTEETDADAHAGSYPGDI